MIALALWLIFGGAVTFATNLLLVRGARRAQRRRDADMARLTEACAHMQRAADGFRELYLRELARNQPAMAEHLRHKWAAQNAPVHVAQLLERAKHG